VSMIGRKLVGVLLGLTLFAYATTVGASVSYITGPTEPWGFTSNVDAMNAAFGAGNWQQHTFANAVGSGVFTPGAYSFLYFDGGDGNDSLFNAFVGANRSALEGWVASGGSLFLNAARWSNSSLDVGFGATLTGDDFLSSTGTAAGLHPIFDVTTGTSWTGTWFSHDIITGTGLTTLITGSDGVVLAEKDWGSGNVMIGGMTSTGWHLPQPAAFNLRVHILNYGAGQAGQAVPEPASLAVWSLLSVVGISVSLWRRRRS
jgi:hypothetical protein